MHQCEGELVCFWPIMPGVLGKKRPLHVMNSTQSQASFKRFLKGVAWSARLGVNELM